VEIQLTELFYRIKLNKNSFGREEHSSLKGLT